MKKLVFCFLLLTVFFTASVSAITLDELFSKLQGNQLKIKDMQADIATKMTSSMKGMKGMTQKGHIWTKGKTKSKMEMYSPMKQITITNGNKIAVIDPVTGKKHVQDLSKSGQMGASQNKSMNFEKAKEKFNFSMKRLKNGYLVVGVPRDANKFMGKMEIFIDSSKMVPTKIKMFNPSGKVISTTEIYYKKISGVYVAYKNTSKVSLPNGKMTMEMVYSDIKVNEGIADSIFNI